MVEANADSHATAIITSRCVFNDGNCRLTMPVVKGRCANGALPHTLNIGVI